jgi:hypothetical protein
MIEFFVGRFLHLLFDGWITRDDGMPLIKPLSSDFTGMIDPHQARSMCLLFVIQIRFLNICGRVRSRRLSRRGRHSSKRVVHTSEKTVERS